MGVLVASLCLLQQDRDDEVRGEAEKSFASIPLELIRTISRDPSTSSVVLHHFAKVHLQNDEVLETVLLNQTIDVSTFALIAEHCSERVGQLVVSNNRMFLQNPSLLVNLKNNPRILRSSIDYVVGFLKVNGLVLKGEDPVLTKEEAAQLLAQDQTEFQEELVEEVADASLDALDEGEYHELKRNVSTQISMMTPAQRVKLALRGNAFARNVLITDASFIVATAVLQNPRVTLSEVVRYSRMKNVNEKVLRLIAGNKEWMKGYAIRLNLVSNPKTPAYLAIKFLKFMRVQDLRTLSRDRNIPAQVSKVAKQLFKARQ